MPDKETLLTTDLPIGKKHSGKVRDVYDLGDRLLIVTTDRLSAFDVVLPDGIPSKGQTLNELSILWLKKLAIIIDNHFLTDNVAEYPAICQPYAKLLNGRSMLVKKAEPLPVECIVRGHISGSGWESYQKNGTVCGITLPPGLKESQKLPEPIFTPSTKAEAGEHDVNISFEEMIEKIGFYKSAIIKQASLYLYRASYELAKSVGIIIADTKFEFGLEKNGQIILIDEVLTPDSSRFWPVESYKPGGPQPSFDKQFVRDWLKASGWNKKPPAPKLPEEIINKTSEKYKEAFIKLFPMLR